MEAFTPLAPRARLWFHLQAFSRLLLFWTPFSIALGVGLAAVWSASYGPLVAVCFLFLRFLSAVWWPWLEFGRWGWRLDADELLITRGVIFRSVTAIPVGRVQHVDVRQGPIEQWLGLARVQVHTASGLGGDGMIPGLELADADGLRDRLVEAKARGDDGV